MERLRTLKTLCITLLAVLVVELAFLVLQLRPASLTLWVTLAVIALSSLLLARMALGVIRELKERQEGEGRRADGFFQKPKKWRKEKGTGRKDFNGILFATARRADR